jgi:hypothetical protein
MVHGRYTALPHLFWLFAIADKLRFHQMMVPRFLTILTGRNLPKIRQAREPQPSIINEKRWSRRASWNETQRTT